MHRAVPGSVEQRLQQLAITLPVPPTPLGAYAASVQSGQLLFLSGMLPLQDGRVLFSGRLRSAADAGRGRDAARLAAVNGLAVAREHLGSLDRIVRVVSLRLWIAALDEFIDHAEAADGASELLRDVFGRDTLSCRMVAGVSSLPLGALVVLELVFEVKPRGGSTAMTRSMQ